MAIKAVENSKFDELPDDILDNVSGGALFQTPWFPGVIFCVNNEGAMGGDIGAFPYEPGNQKSYDEAVAKAKAHCIECGYSTDWL